jgi:hypothetical protein
MATSSSEVGRDEGSGEAFEQRVDQRFATFEHRVDQRFVEFAHKVDQRFAESEKRMDQQFVAIGHQFAAMDKRMAVFAERLETQTEKFERRLVDECGRVRVGIGGLRTEMAPQRADLLKWAMLVWISQAAAVAGIIGVLR